MPYKIFSPPEAARHFPASPVPLPSFSFLRLRSKNSVIPPAATAAAIPAPSSRAQRLKLKPNTTPARCTASANPIKMASPVIR